mgnify:CR=1 FL=1
MQSFRDKDVVIETSCCFWELAMASTGFADLFSMSLHYLAFPFLQRDTARTPRTLEAYSLVD